MVGIEIDGVRQGCEVEAGRMIHDLFPYMVNALAKYREVARGTVESVVGLDEVEGGGKCGR